MIRPPLRLSFLALLAALLAGCGAMFAVAEARPWVGLIAVVTVVVIIMLVKRGIRDKDDEY